MLMPGTRSSMAARPPAINRWACRPCGSPLRWSGSSGRSSRSRTITSSAVPDSAAAASMPARPAPMTTALRVMELLVFSQGLPSPYLRVRR
ncbi:hypothetical protein SALBM311S_01712 [Streptomyces alboniger]